MAAANNNITTRHPLSPLPSGEGPGERALTVIRLALTALCLLASTTNAQALDDTTEPAGISDISLHVASHWGGPINAAVVEGNRAYIANGRMFRILDLSDESHPVEMGSLELMGGSGENIFNQADGTQDIELRGNYAFVGATGETFFNVIDVTNPRLPNLIRSFPRLDSYGPAGVNGFRGRVAGEVELHGDYAYIKVHDSQRIEVFDIHDPLDVAFVTELTLQDPDRSIHTMTIHEGHLYVSGSSASGGEPVVSAYDLSANPISPPRIGGLPAPPGPPGSNRYVKTNGMKGVGSYLYIGILNFHAEPVWGLPGDVQFGLATIDISNPAHPLAQRAQLDLCSLPLSQNHHSIEGV